MIIRISLLLILVSFALFLSADLLQSTTLPVLPDFITQLGLAILICAGALLLISGGIMIGRLIIRSVLDYFSEQQRLQRRLLFIQARQDQLKQLFYLRTLQINYFTELKRKRLLGSNDRKHILSLSKSIDKDLLSIKQQLPKSAYLQLQQENTHYRKQLDSEALLQLQQKIARLI